MCTASKAYIDMPFHCPHGCKSHVGVGEVVVTLRCFQI